MWGYGVMGEYCVMMRVSLMNYTYLFVIDVESKSGQNPSSNVRVAMGQVGGCVVTWD